MYSISSLLAALSFPALRFRVFPYLPGPCASRGRKSKVSAGGLAISPKHLPALMSRYMAFLKVMYLSWPSEDSSSANCRSTVLIPKAAACNLTCIDPAPS